MMMSGGWKEVREDENVCECNKYIHAAKILKKKKKFSMEWEEERRSPRSYDIVKWKSNSKERRGKKKKKKLIIFTYVKSTHVSKARYVSEEKKLFFSFLPPQPFPFFLTSPTFLIRGWFFSFLFLIFSIIIYFYASPSFFNQNWEREHESERERWRKFFFSEFFPIAKLLLFIVAFLYFSLKLWRYMI